MYWLKICGCDFDILNDIKEVEEIMVNAALEAGAEVERCVFHKFSPQGVSGVVVISESLPRYPYLAGTGIRGSGRVHLW